MKNLIIMTLATISTVIANGQTVDKDDQAVRAIVSTLESSWNAKNGEKFSSVFAEVHDYIVINGLYFSNFTRKGNAQAHQSLFDNVYKNRDIKLKVDKVTFLRPDLAQIIVIGGSFETGKPAPTDPNAIMTIIAEKKDSAWKIISFHNHTLETFQDRRASPMPLEVMYASWYKN